jgi:diguanylate cyclase (GGDEF)-like protein
MEVRRGPDSALYLQGTAVNSLPPTMNPVLINSPLFSAMSGLEFIAVNAFLERRRISKGETIFNEGDRGKDMFVLLSGSLNAFKRQSDGTQRWLFDIAPGGLLGEMSIIANEPRSVTIIAKENSELMVLQGTDFYRIVFEFPMLGIKMLNSIRIVQNGWLNHNLKYMLDLIQWGETARLRAIPDALTGLYNRNFLQESIKDRFKMGAVGARKMSLIMMDLDRVHEINNRYGSAGGDRVIITMADILKSICRPGDIAARLSGDEFVILLPDTGGHDALPIAEKIREMVASQTISVSLPGSDKADEFQIRTSLGIATAPKHADNVRDLLHYADMALRKAKEKGRNRVELYDSEPKQ